MPKPLKILNACASLAEALGSLEREGEIALSCCGIPEEADSLLAIARKDGPDSVILGLGDFGPRAEAIVEALANSGDRPGFDVVVCGPASESERLLACVRSGASGFLLEPADPAALRLVLACAATRIAMRRTIAEERDFFLTAVRNEEILSSKLLDRHMDLKRKFSDIACVKRDLEKENRRLEKAARYDALSGLLNRTSLNARLSLEAKRRDETGSPLSGIMVDLDHFKPINDSYGHQAGDEVIRAVGKCLKSHLRRDDHAGRYGGEEFFLILPDTALEACVSIAERVREGIAAISVQWGDETIAVTASLGVAESATGESVGDWIERADAAMYQAKQIGRNRVISAGRA